MQGGLFGDEGWTPEQYRLAVRTNLSFVHHAVPLYDVESSIGTAALEALVKKNLVHTGHFQVRVRPFYMGGAHIPRNIRLKQHV